MPKLQGPEVPEGLVKLLQDFTVAILRAQPEDLTSFGANYFSTMVRDNPERTSENPIEVCPIKAAPSAIKIEGSPTVRTNFAIKNSSETDDSSEFERNMEREMSAPRFNKRRASVAAEPYNPDKDDESVDERNLSVHEKSVEQAKHLKNVCQKIMLFSELDDKELDHLIDAMFERKVTQGEDIIEEMDDADNFYIIEHGKFEAKIRESTGEDKTVKDYDNFGYFGELALMYNAPRSATITATTDGVLWALSRASFKKFVLGHAAKRRREFISLLHSVKILNDLTPYQRMALADSLQRRNIPKDEFIIREGDPGTEIYFIMNGTVKVTRFENGAQLELTKIEKGGYFGELALLSQKPRAASVTADTDVSLAVLGVESFERLLGPCMDLMRRHASVYQNPNGTEI